MLQCGGSSLILGAQYIKYGSNIRCAKSRYSILMAQTLGAQMRTLSTQLHHPDVILGYNHDQLGMETIYCLLGSGFHSLHKNNPKVTRCKHPRISCTAKSLDLGSRFCLIQEKQDLGHSKTTWTRSWAFLNLSLLTHFIF